MANRTLSLLGDDPTIGDRSDWQLNLPRSIRDIVRREKWATSRQKECVEWSRTHFSENDSIIINLRYNATIHFGDEDAPNSNRG